LPVDDGVDGDSVDEAEGADRTGSGMEDGDAIASVPTYRFRSVRRKRHRLHAIMSAYDHSLSAGQPSVGYTMGIDAAPPHVTGLSGVDGTGGNCHGISRDGAKSRQVLLHLRPRAMGGASKLLCRRDYATSRQGTCQSVGR